MVHPTLFQRKNPSTISLFPCSLLCTRVACSNRQSRRWQFVLKLRFGRTFPQGLLSEFGPGGSHASSPFSLLCFGFTPRNIKRSRAGHTRSRGHALEVHNERAEFFLRYCAGRRSCLVPSQLGAGVWTQRVSARRLYERPSGSSEGSRTLLGQGLPECCVRPDRDAELGRHG